jgi:hypothetical protein
LAEWLNALAVVARLKWLMVAVGIKVVLRDDKVDIG